MSPRVGLLALFASATTVAGPIEPDKLPQLSPKPTGKGAPVVLYVAKTPVDHVVRMLIDNGNFLMVADQATFEGRIDKPVPLDAALGATGAKYVTPRGGGGKTVDLDFYQAPPKDLIRLLADVGGMDLIYAPSKEPSTVTVRVKGVDARTVMRELIKISGLDLMERAGTWIVIDKPATLDPKLASVTAKNVQIRVNGATPGEIEQLIDPKAAPGRCPKAHGIDAKLRRGQTGLLLAVAASIQGPACGSAPANAVAKDGKLVGTLRGPKLGRGVFRHANGTQIVTPANPQDVGDTYVTLGADTALLYPSLGAASSIVEDWRATLPCGAEKKNYQLRATAKIGNAWRALLIGSDGTARMVTETKDKAKISAGRVECVGGPSYALTAP